MKRLLTLVLCLATSASAGSGSAAAAAAAVKAKKSRDAKSKHHAKKDEPVEAEPEEKAPAAKTDENKGPVHCKVGVYFLDVSNVDMKESLFSVDFYLWMTWHSDAADSCDFELQNADSEERKESYKEVKGDLHYVVYRIKGRLKGQFELQRYPFDTQTLPLHLESPGHAAREVLFEAEAMNEVEKALPFRGLDRQVRVAGWQVKQIQFVSSLHRYDTRFGYPFGDEDNEQDYSRLSYTITAERLAWPYFLRAFLPLLIVVGCACLLFLLSWEKVDVAMGSAITALLAAIALHLVEAGALPSIGYLVALDKFFIWSYTVVLFISIEKVLAYRLGSRQRTAEADRLDRISVLAIPALYLAGNAVILATSLH
jgi:hypothetical protein